MSVDGYCLRNTDIYNGLCKKKVSQAGGAKDVFFAKGHVFYTPETPANHIYIIKSGEVELYQLQGGKKIVLETLFPGDVFGDFLGENATNHFARCLRKTQVCKTEKGDFLEMVKKFPEIALNLMKELAKKTRYYEDKISVLSLPAKDQLLYELKTLSAKNKQSILGKFFAVPLRISHQKLAEKTGLNRVTVTKLMKELKSEKRILVDEKTKIIEILD